MAKTIQIPTDCTRVYVCINGVTYVYAGGETVTVPDNVAAAIMEGQDMKPKTGGDKTLDERIESLISLLKATALDLETVSAGLEDLQDSMEALEKRVKALEDKETPEDTSGGGG